MKKIFSTFGLLLILCISTKSFANLKDTIPANNKFIEYTGRIDFSNELAPKFSYSGVSIRASFTGTRIAAILNDDQGQNFYNVIIDGKVTDVIQVQTGERTYVLAENLNDSIHEVELFKRTELTFGKTQFLGFILETGNTLVPISNRRTKLIEFIGNSITCGYGNEGTESDNFLNSNENHYMTYAAITARNFNARHIAVSRSGIGMYRNYNGPFEGSDDCMYNLYARIFMYDKNSPLYSFKEQPDLICINLGTNDFSTTGGDSASFTNNYLKMIDFLQSKYNDPDIVCLLGPMMSGNTLSQVRRILKTIVRLANNKNTGRVQFFEMSAQKGDLGIGVNYHPTVAQHQKNAKELVAFISEFKGWKIVNNNMNQIQ